MKKLRKFYFFMFLVALSSNTYAQITGFKIKEDTCKTLTLSISVTGTSNSPYFFWNFGDPNSGAKDTITIIGTSASPFPVHTFSAAGQYKVCVSYQETNLPVTTFCKNLNVANCKPKDNECELVMPSIFTPNGTEPTNSFIHPFYEENPIRKCTFEQYDFQIFDSWGKLVFKTDKVAEKWDGKSDGVECPAGVYTYYLIYKLSNQESKKRPGNITLIR